jgi:hypothetical protein
MPRDHARGVFATHRVVKSPRVARCIRSGTWKGRSDGSTDRCDRVRVARRRDGGAWRRTGFQVPRLVLRVRPR